jgi:hypothetical protein
MISRVMGSDTATRVGCAPARGAPRPPLARYTPARARRSRATAVSLLPPRGALPGCADVAGAGRAPPTRDPRPGRSAVRGPEGVAVRATDRDSPPYCCDQVQEDLAFLKLCILPIVARALSWDLGMIEKEEKRLLEKVWENLREIQVRFPPGRPCGYDGRRTPTGL